jgi:hypothetical protein
MRLLPFKIPEVLKPKRRWFQFRLGSLLWMALVVCVALGWWRDRRQLEQQIHDLQRPSPYWEPAQATGPPDTPRAGDITTAWASATPDSQKEWLLLDYARSVRPTAVVIHETYNPGAVYQVSVFDVFGREHVAWAGTDPTPSTAAKGVSRIPINTNVWTSRVKVYIDSPAVRGWNEIDAVGLVDGSGRTRWATHAKASSTYGANFARGLGGGGPWPFVVR